VLPEAPLPVARQLDAYNRQDVAAFSACYTDDVLLEDAEKGPFVRGRAQLEERYAKLFREHPENRARVVNRSITGSWVFEEEEVSRSGSTFRVFVVYRLRDALIDRATFYK
jgi:hypothetical protein